MSVAGFEVENKPRKPLLIADILLRVFHEAVFENYTGNSIIPACWTKRSYPVSKPTQINLLKLQLSVTHHWKPPRLWLCTSQGITHIISTSSSTWSAVAVHGQLSEDNPIGFRGAVLFEMLQKNTGSVSGCACNSLKKGIKRTIQSKKCKVDTEKIWKCVKRAENCNETKTCANKSGLEAMDHMYMTQERLFVSFSILILTLIALVEKLAPNPSSVMLVWYLPDVDPSNN